jgi:lipopolysaccharide export system permease protein
MRLFIPVFLAALIFFMMILQLTELFTNLWKFLNYDTPAAKIVEVMILYLPKCVSYSLPVSLLFAISFVLGNLYMNNELIAVFGSGISLYSLVVPFIAVGLILSVAGYYFENNVVILTLRQKNELTRELLHQKVSLSNSNITIISTGNNIIYHVDYYNEGTQSLNGIEVLERSRDGEKIGRAHV